MEQTTQILVVIDSQTFYVNTKEEAQQIADNKDMDLVPVAPNVYKVMDYNKYLYRQQKNQKQTPKQETKEAYINTTIAENDLMRKINHICKWLRHGNAVKISIKIHGNEQHKIKLGVNVMNSIIDEVFIHQSLSHTPIINMPNENSVTNEITVLLKPKHR